MSTASRQDLYRYVAEEFAEDYQHGEMDRREFLRRATLLGGGVAGAHTLLSTLDVGAFSVAEIAAAAGARPNLEPVSQAAQVEPNDPAIRVEDIPYDARGFENLAYLARPAAGEAAPGILVIHENRGLQEHIKDVARRLAKAGYVALAPDLMSSAGGTARFTDTAQISSTLAQTSGDEHVANLKEALTLLRNTSGVQADKLGVVGFCFGGGLAWRLATEAPELGAAVPFYGPAPDIARVPDIEAAVLGIYGGNDARINAGIPALREALEQAGVRHEILVYEGANHAFHNDTGQNYNREAATDAWARTLAWFEANLS